nr:histidine phosphatase family protein [Sphingorhabdus sp. Alg239-R122]
MAKTLTLLRHAKSEWGDRGTRDFDRPINARGEAGAKLISAWIRREELEFDLVLASPATRVTQTIDQLEKNLDIALNPEWDRRIYLASSATLMDVLRSVEGDPQHVMMVGHNPGLEDLIFDLVPDDGTQELRDVVEQKFPTAALAVLELDIGKWSDVGNGKAVFTKLIRPRDMDASLGPQMDRR